MDPLNHFSPQEITSWGRPKSYIEIPASPPTAALERDFGLPDDSDDLKPTQNHLPQTSFQGVAERLPPASSSYDSIDSIEVQSSVKSPDAYHDVLLPFARATSPSPLRSQDPPSIKPSYEHKSNVNKRIGLFFHRNPHKPYTIPEVMQYIDKYSPASVRKALCRRENGQEFEGIWESKLLSDEEKSAFQFTSINFPFRCNSRKYIFRPRPVGSGLKPTI